MRSVLIVLEVILYAIYGSTERLDDAYFMATQKLMGCGCDERIQKIQTIKMMEGIFICAAPHCLKSFLKRIEFESHIHESHADLLHPNVEKEDGNESEAHSAKQSTASDSTVKVPPRPVFSPGSNSQLQDREDRARRQQPREPPLPRSMMQTRPSLPFGQVQNHPLELQSENRAQGLDRSGSQNNFHQQSFEMQGGLQQESSHFPDKQQGVSLETAISEYSSQHLQQPLNFAVPINSNPLFSYPPVPSEGVQSFYGTPYEMARSDSAPEVVPEQSSLLGFPPGPPRILNSSESYRRSWNAGSTVSPFETPLEGQAIADGLSNPPDSQRPAFFQGDYGRSPASVSMNPPHPSNKGTESVQGNNPMDPRDGKGVLAPQPLPFPPPPPPPLPPHLLPAKWGKFYSGDAGHDGQGFGWAQHEKRNSFGSGQDQ
ncbi:E3 ubiquitin-protein ligase HAKAI homolog isoform X2 [Malania oleifera]|uniref:E3 ubiquitin-protein ligase HAKAI homolog isoform X2 n=1 Tax=Malania oleifera TaxID=397392 RepID=UPI0025ADECA5|nr:E3 ubiquitin-protein ligase HAKAI homolog isoform X2 [Malania oleifera]